MSQINSKNTTAPAGSPGAAVTIDGKISAVPAAKVRQCDQARGNRKPFWSATVVPPTGAPNGLLIMAIWQCRLIAEFERNLGREPVIWAGAPLDYVPTKKG